MHRLRRVCNKTITDIVLLTTVPFSTLDRLRRHVNYLPPPVQVLKLVVLLQRAVRAKVYVEVVVVVKVEVPKATNKRAPRAFSGALKPG